MPQLIRHLLPLTIAGLVATAASPVAASAEAADTTPPTISFTTPSEGQHFVQGQHVPSDFDCADEPGGSGVVTCIGLTYVRTSALSSFAYEVIATDAAGNRAIRSVRYYVDRKGTDLTAPTRLSELRVSVPNRILHATFRLNRFATLQISLLKLGGGVMKGDRCVRPPRNARSGKHCDLPLGPYTDPILGAQRHSMILPGQLQPGRYRLTLSDKDGHGDGSSVSAAFVVVREKPRRG